MIQGKLFLEEAKQDRNAAIQMSQESVFNAAAGRLLALLSDLKDSWNDPAKGLSGLLFDHPS